MQSSTRSKLVFVLGLALAWVPFASVVVDSSKALLYRDVSNVYLPFKALWARGVLELGRLPYWNPFHASGVPFLSDPTFGIFHPGNLIFLLFSARPERGMFYFLLLHYFLLYTGGFLLARALRARAWLCLVAGLSLAWGGYAMSSWNIPHDLAGQSAVPFFFYFFLRARQCSRRRWSLAAAAALVFPVLGGDAQFTYMMSGISFLTCLALPDKWEQGKRLLRIYGIAILLGAPQLLPTLAHFSETTRASGILGPGEQLAWSLHPFRLIELLLPLPFGSRPNYGEYAGYSFISSQFRTDPFVFSIYPGLFAVFFGLAYATAFLHRRRRWKKINFRALAGFLLLLFLSLGTNFPLPLSALFGRFVPLWGAFRYPERLTFWVSFALWLFAVRGAERWLRLIALGTRPPRAAIVFYAACAASLLALWRSGDFPVVLVSLGILIVVGVILELSARRIIPLDWLAPLCACALSLESAIVAQRLVWPMPATIAQRGFSEIQSKVFTDREKNAGEFSRGGAFRLYTLGQAFIDESKPAEAAGRAQYGSMEREMRKAWAYLRYYTGSTFGLELSMRQNTLSPIRYIYRLEKASPWQLNRFLDLSATRYLVMEEEKKVVVRPSALPYASLPSFVERTDGEPALVARLNDRSWDPHGSMLLEGAGTSGANPQCWFVQDVIRSWDRNSLQLTSTGFCGSSTLLVNEAFDQGWRASLSDGTSLVIERANGWAQGIRIPAAKRAGESISLQLEYREKLFFPGCLLFLLGLAAGLLL
ncbi:MAG: hypothetical protein ACXWR1_13090 [Bdellovibrionota bacterium]